MTTFEIPASCFHHGCTCGHSIRYRDTFHLVKNKKYNFGKTIKPKVSPIQKNLKN